MSAAVLTPIAERLHKAADSVAALERAMRESMAREVRLTVQRDSLVAACKQLQADWGERNLSPAMAAIREAVALAERES